MKNIKKIPYGITDFKLIQEENYYYVDKTRFIPILEKSARYLFLIRPRRFGKTLWITILEGYYDRWWKDEFETIFGKTYIGKNPTSLHNTYTFLYFNFSVVNPQLDKLERSFEDHCDTMFWDYNSKHGNLFHKTYLEEFKQKETSSAKLDFIFATVKKCGVKLYLAIDEYDNFANTILSSYGQKKYEELTHGEGFFRHFFNVIKGGTSKIDAAVSRLFITGVSPVTMDDVTSGFNIGTNITTDSQFNEIIGFTETEVREMLTYYKEQGVFKENIEKVMNLMKIWYNNYTFSKKAENKLFNSDMVLNFMLHYLPYNEIPEKLLDDNIRTDYRKLRHLMMIDNKLNGNFSILKEIVENKEISAEIQTSFAVRELLQKDKFISLLYFFGIITITGTRRGKSLFKVPNKTMWEFVSQYIREAYKDANIFKIDWYDYSNMIENMAYEGKWKEVFEFLTIQIKDQSKIRDYIEGEAMIKGFLLAYLNITDHYIIRTEQEMNKGFADFYLEPFMLKHTEMPYSYIIEIKYLSNSKKDEPENEINKLVADAEKQLKIYAKDPFILQTKSTTELKKIVLVYNTWKLVYYKEI